MALSYVKDMDSAAFAVIVESNGDAGNFLRLENIQFGRYFTDESKLKKVIIITNIFLL